MKKSLIALAVMAAAGAASAQSSVTLFGIVDATLAWGRGDTADRFQVTNSGYNSSRLGFRGTEDLGGGMSASFWLEAGVNNDNGSGALTDTNNQGGTTGGGGLTFNRRSTVSLGGNWGEVRIGRDYTPQFWNLTVFDPFGTNGVGTNQILNGVALPLIPVGATFVNPFTGAAVAGATGASTVGTGSLYPTQVRASNSIGYFFPRNLGGFYGQAQYYVGENLDNAANEDAGEGWGVRVGFASGPFNIAAAYSTTEVTLGGVNGDIKTWNIGGQWDFGMAKIMAQYNRDKLDVGGSSRGRGWLVGGLIPVGAGEIRLSFSQYEIDASAPAFAGFAGFDDPRTRKLALGYVHNLSKRTALYTTVARVRNSGGAASSLNGSVTGANDSSTGLDIGIRHSF
jgi:predicted porin